MVLVFALRPWIERLPIQIRVAAALIGLSFAAEQVVGHRKFAKNVLASVDTASSIEYRVASGSANMPGARLWLPGSLAQWFNRWSDGQQMTGSSWSTAYNSVHQKIASRLIYSSSPKDADIVFLWLKAYGVQAASIPGPRSPEFWKAIKRSDLFDGCDVLWQEDDTKLCRVPGASGSLAHVVPREAVVRRDPSGWQDTTEVRRFSVALDTAS